MGRTEKTKKDKTDPSKKKTIIDEETIQAAIKELDDSLLAAYMMLTLLDLSAWTLFEGNKRRYDCHRLQDQGRRSWRARYAAGFGQGPGPEEGRRRLDQQQPRQPCCRRLPSAPLQRLRLDSSPQARDRRREHRFVLVCLADLLIFASIFVLLYDVWCLVSSLNHYMCTFATYCARLVG
jgi:hypothetical protein